MTTERYDIVVTDTGVDKAKANFDDLATSVEKTETKVDTMRDAFKGLATAGVNPALNSIQQVGNATRTMQSALGSANASIAAHTRGLQGATAGSKVYATGLGLTQRAAGAFGTALGSVASGIANVGAAAVVGGSKLFGLAQGAGQGGASLETMGTKARRTASLLQAVVAGLAVKQFIDYAKAADDVSFELNKLSGSATTYASNYRELFNASQRTGTSFKDNIVLSAALNDAFGTSQGRVTTLAGGVSILNTQLANFNDTTSLVAQAIALSGSSSDQAARATAAYADAVKSGTVTLEQYQTIAANAPMLAAQIARAYGTTTQEFAAATAAGAISSRAFVQYTNDARNAIAALTPPPLSISAGFQVLSNAALNYFTQLNTGSGAQAYFVAGLQLLAANIGTVVNVAAILGAAIATLIAIQVVVWIGSMALAFAGATVAVIAKTAALYLYIAGLIVANPIMALVAATLAVLAAGWLNNSGAIDTLTEKLKGIIETGKTAYNEFQKLVETQKNNAAGAEALKRAMSNYNGTVVQTTSSVGSLGGAVDSTSSSMTAGQGSANGLAGAYNNVAAAASNAAAAMAEAGRARAYDYTGGAGDTTGGQGAGKQNGSNVGGGSEFDTIGSGSMTGRTLSFGSQIEAIEAALSVIGPGMLFPDQRIKYTQQLQQLKQAEGYETIMKQLALDKNAVTRGEISAADFTAKYSQFDMSTNGKLGIPASNSGEFQDAIKQGIFDVNNASSSTNPSTVPPKSAPAGQLSPQGFVPLPVPQGQSSATKPAKSATVININVKDFDSFKRNEKQMSQDFARKLAL